MALQKAIQFFNPSVYITLLFFVVCNQDKSENLKLVGFVYYVSNVVSPEEIITEA